MPGGWPASGNLHAKLGGLATVERQQVVAGQHLKVEGDGALRRSAHVQRNGERRAGEERPVAEGDRLVRLALLTGSHDPLRPFLYQRRATIANALLRGHEWREHERGV